MTTHAAIRSQAEICADYRAALDEIDEINLRLKRASARKEALQREALAYMTREGLTRDGDKISAGGITLTRADKWRPAYDPEKWTSIVKWAIESGNDHIVQRRLSASPIMELVDAGVPLPDGLSVESYTELSHRRSSRSVDQSGGEE